MSIRFKLSGFAFTGALLLASCVPAMANGVHSEKNVSAQGNLSDANFTGVTGTVDGISYAQFDDQTTLLDIFTLPASFTTGTAFTISMSDIDQGYGLWSCGPGATQGTSADDMPIVGACTPGINNESFVSFNEVGNTSTVAFLGGADAPSTYTFWVTALDLNGNNNLLDIKPVSTTNSMPEPSSILLLASGLAGLLLLRRRAEA